MVVARNTCDVAFGPGAAPAVGSTTNTLNPFPVTSVGGAQPTAVATVRFVIGKLMLPPPYVPVETAPAK